MDANKQVFGSFVPFIGKTEHSVQDQRDHESTCRPPALLCATNFLYCLRKRSNSLAYILTDPFRIVLRAFSGESVPQADKARHFWNPIITGDQKEKTSGFDDTRVVRCTSPNYLLVNCLVNNMDSLIYCKCHAEMDM